MKNRTARSIRANIATLGVVIASLLLMPALARATTDAQIERAVETELILDAAVPFNDVDVAVIDGIVTLDGETDNLLSKRRATAVSEAVKGVRGVVNDVRLDLPATLDSELEQRVEDALLYDPAADLYEIEVSVDKANITLRGTVDSYQERRHAERVALGVSGVRSVENLITVDYSSERPDFDIEADVQARLEWDALIADRLLEVEVDDGKVRLSGTVASAAERSRAREDGWVAGVSEVDVSEITINPILGKPDVKDREYAYKSDDAVRDAVYDALLYDPRVLSTNVEVTVDSGTVLLTGAVETLAARKAAERTTGTVTGVWRVKNHLKVRPVEDKDDTLIEKDVHNALVRDPYIEPYQDQINVDSSSGRVALYGHVSSNFEKFRATDIASRAEAVVEVDNFLTVRNEADVSYLPDPTWDIHGYAPYWSVVEIEPYKTDWAIQDDIESELFWSPFVDADQVEVEVEDGTATLSGTVDTWVEHGAAIENAYEGGAYKVVDNLGVHRGPALLP